MAFSWQEPWRTLSLLTDAPKTFYEVLGLPVLEEFADFQESLQRRLVSLPSHVSQAERFMFSMLGDEVPCRPLYSRSDIRRAIVKQLVRLPYILRCINKDIIPSDSFDDRECMAFLANHDVRMAELRIYVQSTSAEELQRAEEVIVAHHVLLNFGQGVDGNGSNVVYDHQLRLAIDDDAQRRATRRHILDFRSNLLYHWSEDGFLHRLQYLDAAEPPVDSAEPFWEERRYLLLRFATMARRASRQHSLMTFVSILT